jgi:hypothetical protein
MIPKLKLSLTCETWRGKGGGLPLAAGVSPEQAAH